MLPFNTNDTLEVQFKDGSVYVRKHVLFNKAIDISADGKAKITWAELLPITQVFEAGASTVRTDSSDVHSHPVAWKS